MNENSDTQNPEPKAEQKQPTKAHFATAILDVVLISICGTTVALFVSPHHSPSQGHIFASVMACTGGVIMLIGGMWRRWLGFAILLTSLFFLWENHKSTEQRAAKWKALYYEMRQRDTW